MKTVTINKAKSLTDPSIFNFYDNLIEGENRSNTSKFDAYNVTLNQTFLNNRLGIVLSVQESNVYVEQYRVDHNYNRVPTAGDPRTLPASRVTTGVRPGGSSSMVDTSRSA